MSEIWRHLRHLLYNDVTDLSQTYNMSLPLLPELWREICTFLSLQDLQNLRLSCHLLYNDVTETLYCRYGYRILLRSAEEGHFETVVKMLPCNFDPILSPFDPNPAFRFARTYDGHLEVVKLLLADSRVDPILSPFDPNAALRFARKYDGHLEVVKLLADSRVDPIIMLFFWLVKSSFPEFIINKPEKYGGNTIFKSHQEHQELYFDAHPGDLRKGALNELLEPIRQKFNWCHDLKKVFR